MIDTDSKQQIYQQKLVELAKKKDFLFSNSELAKIKFDKKVLAHNPLCGDKYDFYLKISQNDSDRVEAISYEGDGCLVSKASANLLCEHTKSILDLKTSYHTLSMFMASSESANHLNHKLDIDWDVFSPIKPFALRHRCVLLVWEALAKAL